MVAGDAGLSGDAVNVPTAIRGRQGTDGLGMGLSICRTLVTSHGGRLWAERRAERGAAFYVALPLADEHPTVGGALISGAGDSRLPEPRPAEG
jgi:hypothetical protein